MALEGYKSNNHVVYSSKYHVVWTPKYRRPVLVDKIAFWLQHLLHETCLRYQAEVVAVEIMPDHVHLLVEVDPLFGIHRLVKKLKGVTSHNLRKAVPVLKSRLPTRWTNSYFVRTVGGAPLAVIQQSVENQKHV
jgi:REP-associated tyrosine transposase